MLWVLPHYQSRVFCPSGTSDGAGSHSKAALYEPIADEWCQCDAHGFGRGIPARPNGPGRRVSRST